MTIVERGISWSGDGIDLNLFVVWSTPPPVEPDFVFESEPLGHLKIFYLTDEARVLGDLSVTEYDLHFEQMPPRLADYLTACLKSVVSLGARAAWFGGEGSFDFDHLLSRSVATQVYAVADGEGSVDLALEDVELQGSRRETRLIQVRESLRLPPHR